MSKSFKNSSASGFTMIELLVIIGIISILASSSLFIYGNLQPSTELGEFSVQLTQLIRRARNLSINGYHNSSHGVYIDAAANKAILYQGESYTERDQDLDHIVDYNSGIAIEAALPEPDINFDKWTGFPKISGSVNLNYGVIGMARQININTLGVVDLD